MINIGRNISNGVLTSRDCYFDQNILKNHALLIGSWRAGKIVEAVNIVNQIKDVETIIFNLQNIFQNRLYLINRYIRVPQDHISIPYLPPITNKGIDDRSLTELTSLLLLDIPFEEKYRQDLEIIIKSFLNEFFSKESKPPEFFHDLIKCLADYLDSIDLPEDKLNPLKFFTHLVSDHSPSDKSFSEITKFTGKIPDWLNAFRNGEKISFNLRHCIKTEQIFIIRSILSLLRATYPLDTENKVRGLVLFDEPYEIFCKPDITCPEQKFYEQYFPVLMDDLKRRGIGLIFVNEEPYGLYDCICKQPNLKILFGFNMMWWKYYKKFHLSENDSEILDTLRDRETLVLNRITKERYLMKTKDFSI
ncbi:hypothetical protein ES706_01859 [subsurface metagenome]